MTESNRVQDDAQYMARLIIHGMEAGYTLEDERFKRLVAAAMVLEDRASGALDQAASLFERKDYGRAAEVLTDVIDEGERYFAQHPKSLAEEAYGLTLARLYNSRAAVRAGEASACGGSRASLQQALSDVNKAISYPSMYYRDYAPDFYSETSQLSDLVNSMLKQTLTASDNTKMIAEARKLETAVGDIKSRLMREDKEGNPYVATSTATYGIEVIEAFFNRYREELTRDPRIKAVFGSYLVTFYATRGRMRFLAGTSGASDRQQLLKDASTDIEQALNFPASYYNNPDLKPSLNEFQSEIREAQKEKNGCFIATAAYGSPLAPEIVVLQCFREARLRPHRTGRWMISVYERYSPPLADTMAPHPTVRLWVRRLLLTPAVFAVRRWFS